jgi:hypothetical protein
LGELYPFLKFSQNTFWLKKGPLDVQVREWDALLVHPKQSMFEKILFSVGSGAHHTGKVKYSAHNLFNS